MGLKVTNERVERAITAFVVDVLSERANKSKPAIHSKALSLMESGLTLMGMKPELIIEGLGDSSAFDSVHQLSPARTVALPHEDELIEDSSYSNRETARELWGADEDTGHYHLYEVAIPEGRCYPDAVQYLLDDAFEYQTNKMLYVGEYGPNGSYWDENDIYDPRRLELVETFVAQNGILMNDYREDCSRMSKIHDDLDKLCSLTRKSIGNKRSITALTEGCPEIMPYIRQILKDDGNPEEACSAKDPNLADLASCMRVKEDC